MSVPHRRSHRSRSPARSREGGAVLTLERFLAHPPEVVWRAVTDPTEVRRWFLTEAQVEAWVGGRVDLVTGSYRLHATGKVVAWDPPRLYEYEWNIAPRASFPEGERAVVRWELRPENGGTLLVVTHRDLTRRTAGVFGVGMEAFLDRLVAQLSGEPLPDWDARVKQLRQGREGGSRSTAREMDWEPPTLRTLRIAGPGVTSGQRLARSAEVTDLLWRTHEGTLSRANAGPSISARAVRLREVS